MGLFGMLFVTCLLWLGAMPAFAPGGSNVAGRFVAHA